MLFAHHSDVPWDAARWPNFTARALACSCRECGGEYWHDPRFIDALQMARTEVGFPLRINSGHRCALHNARVGGAPLSAHKTIAADISIRGLTPPQRARLLAACQQAGFKGFGFYTTWLHVDMARPRQWFVGQGRALWTSVL